MSRLGSIGAAGLLLPLFAAGCLPRPNGGVSEAPTAGLRIALLRDALPGTDLAAVDRLANDLRAAGCEVLPLTADAAARTNTPALRACDVFLVPNAESYPRDGFAALASLRDTGRNLVLLGGPAFAQPAWLWQGRWTNERLLADQLARTRPERILFDFETPPQIESWRRAVNDRTIRGTLAPAAPGVGGRGRCLEFAADDFTGWDTWYTPDTDNLFAPGHTLLCLFARGDARTPQASIELVEADGSRWFAVLELTEAWQPHVLGPGRFRYWNDSPTRDRRGGPGDRIDPARVRVMKIGLATTHTTRVPPGPHRFWLDEIGTARDALGDARGGAAASPAPRIEAVSPPYKGYRADGLVRLRPAPGQALLAGRTAPSPAPAAWCPHARPMGKGFGAAAPLRWVPLVEALDAAGAPRGAPVSLLVTAQPAAAGTVAVFGYREGDVAASPFLRAALRQTCGLLARGLVLLEGGADRPAYRPGEPVELGCRVANKGAAEAAVRVRLTLRARPAGKVVAARDVALRVDPAGGAASARFRADGPLPEGEYEARAELLDAAAGGLAADAIAHEVRILAAPPAGSNGCVQVRGGEFILDGQPWRPVGVNYWPGCSAGLEAADYFAHWLKPGWYDGDYVERELAQMAELGINLVSIQWQAREHAPGLIDFMARCLRHGIRVNLFVPWISPLAFREEEFAAAVREAGLSGHPALFAYDMIWEPGNHLFNGQNRPGWDADWRAWLEERYGSVAQAEADWACAAPRREGRVSCPTDAQMREDGDWRPLVAAYRRFMDDRMSRKWNDAVRRIRRVDPTHLVSFRQGNTLPHDFTLTATVKHTDFVCPEGYAFPDSDDGYHAAAFTTRYIDFTSGGKPIVWAEFGLSVWDGPRGAPDPQLVARQARYHERFYRMVLATGANGTIPWWWPGGYRVDEQSDFGIVGPDGALRPAAELIRTYGPRIRAASPRPAATAWVTVDRDAHPGGYWHLVFGPGRDAAAAALGAGQVPGVRTPGTGTTSVDTPLVAVGNRPCNGSNPPKYLNAEFNIVRVRIGDGPWREVANGATLPAPPGAPVLLACSVGNLQEAAWVPPAETGGRPGGVFLAAILGDGAPARAPVPRATPYLGDVAIPEFALPADAARPLQVTLQMEAEGRTRFGERWRFTLAPAGAAGGGQ